MQVVDEARRMLRERPLFVAAVTMMVALSLGVRAAIFYEADGEDLRLIADRIEPSAQEADVASDPMMRMGARLQCTEKIPGFTVIVGLSHYSVELSVPVRGMQHMFEQAPPDVARALEIRELPRAA